MVNYKNKCDTRCTMVHYGQGRFFAGRDKNGRFGTSLGWVGPPMNAEHEPILQGSSGFTEPKRSEGHSNIAINDKRSLVVTLLATGTAMSTGIRS